MNVQIRNSSFDRFLQSIASIGKKYIPAADNGLGRENADLSSLCEQILTCRGEASVLALIAALQNKYSKATDKERLDFFGRLVLEFGLVVSEIESLQHLAGDQEKYARFVEVTRSRRQMLFQQISASAGGIAFLVNMRSDLGRFLRVDPHLQPVDVDLKTLFQQWFTRGLLELRRIDWDTSANILSKLQKYEAVHRIESWDDLHRRLMTDRRCFGFFHPALADDPLIFIQVALTTERSTKIDHILNQANILDEVSRASHAVFYSISNCQEGLRGISFGSFLIKQVSEQLQSELPNLRHFMTLSPLPAFRRSLRDHAVELEDDLQEHAMSLLASQNQDVVPMDMSLEKTGQVAARYLTQKRDGKLLDPVARFHLGNGAILDGINVGANMSSSGIEQSFGVMVNYRYELVKLERNHEQFHQAGSVTMSRSVTRLTKTT